MILIISVSGLVLVGSALSRHPSIKPSDHAPAQSPGLRNPKANVAPSPNFVAVCPANHLDLTLACLIAVIDATSSARSSEGIRLTFSD